MRLMQIVSSIKPSVNRKWILSYIYCIQIFLRFIGLLGGYKMLNLSNQEKGGGFWNMNFITKETISLKFSYNPKTIFCRFLT